MSRSALFGTTALVRSPDAPGGGAAAVVDPAAAVAAAAQAAPVVAASAAEPAAAVPATDAAPAATVVVDPAAAAEPAKPADAVAAKPDAHAIETLLEGAGKPEDAKPGDAAKPADKAGEDAAKAVADAAKAAEPAKPAEGEPVLPVLVTSEHEFKLPDGIKGDAPELKEFTALLAKDGVKAETAQTLLDRHAAAMTQFAEHMASEQHRIFSETRAGWKNEVLADPQIGGSGHQTAMMAIARMRDLLVPETDRSSFNEFLRVTGAGDHPQFLKLLHTAARYFDEPGAPTVIGSPPAKNGEKPGRKGRGLQSIYADTAAAKTT